LYCVIGDCAYTPSENLVPIFRAEQAIIAKNDNFNFFASQLRIRIEMAFGLMVKKWAILSRPLSIKLKNIKRLILCIAKLHNFCINERLLITGPAPYIPRNVGFTQHENMLRDHAAYEEFEELQHNYENAWSNNRDRMVKEIKTLQFTRPGSKKSK
jgi:DDE superfamily endonuclease